MVILLTAIAFALVLSGIDFAAIQVRKAFGRIAGHLVWLAILPVSVFVFFKIHFLSFVLGLALSAGISMLLAARHSRKGPWSSNSARASNRSDNDSGFDFGGGDDD